MKNITKKIIAVFAVLAVAAMGLTGCGDKNKNKDESSVSAPKRYPFEVGSATEGNGLTISDPNQDLNAADPVAPTGDDAQDVTSSADENTQPATEVEEVTEADGQPATQYVPVTEANGETATDANGAEVTEAVVVTQIATKPSQSGNGNAQTATQAVNDYTPKQDGRYAMWLDISKDKNFFFENEMITATFKVKEDIPNGDYKVKISPDLSDIAGVAVSPEKVIDGVIRVNNGEIEAVDVSGETGMVFYGDSIACKQGDTIDFNINIKNNSGLAAFCIWFYFDSNALEFVEAYPTGEFDEIARSTEIGGEKVE